MPVVAVGYLVMAPAMAIGAFTTVGRFDIGGQFIRQASPRQSLQCTAPGRQNNFAYEMTT